MTAFIGFCRALAGHPADLPELEYVWLEAPLDARIGKRDDLGDWNDLAAWPVGRLFGKRVEYRWQSRSPQGPLHGVYITENGTLPAAFGPQVQLEPIEFEESALVLWGEWVDPKEDRESNRNGGPSFYTATIPGILDYPVDMTGGVQGKTPRLLIRRYRHESLGEFVRCVGFDLRCEESKDD